MSESKTKRAAFRAATRIVTLGNLAARVLGLARDVVLAALFRRDETDAFLVAFTIPNVLRQILGEAAASSAVAPALSKQLAKGGDDAARALFQRIRGAATIVLVLVTVAGVLLARPLTDLFAAGYHDRPGTFEKTVSLTRNVFPYLLLTGIASLGAAALHVKQRYKVVSFAPLLLNVAIVAAAFALPAVFEARGIDRTQAIVFGALLGGALQIVIQTVSLRRAGWAGPAIVDLRDPGVRDIARRIAPICLGAFVYAIDLILSRRFLSDFGPGAQSWFTWAMRLCDFPSQMFALAVSAVAATSLSKIAAKGGDLAKATSIDMRLTLFFTVPASVALVVLAQPLVALVFERGEFDASSSWETSRALVWQASAVWVVATSRHLVSLLYALRSTRTPLVAGAIEVVMFVAIVLALRGRMGHVAISVAVAGASFAQMTALFLWARRKLPSLGVIAIVFSGARTLVASVVAALAAWSITLLLAAPAQAGGLARALPGVAALLAFTAIYVGAAWSLRSPELAAVVETLRSRRRAA